VAEAKDWKESWWHKNANSQVYEISDAITYFRYKVYLCRIDFMALKVRFHVQ